MNTSLLIALAVIGTAASGAIELFALHAESETSQIVIRLTGLLVFGAMDMSEHDVLAASSSRSRSRS